MFKNIKEVYGYYVFECERYKKYKETWGWIQPEHSIWEVTQDYMDRQLIELHAMERALDLSEDEKRSGGE